ncbi:allophanate hydrolase-related protein [Streptosporangium sp. CA-115845]|uniref:allophanate hydrolase-related protein n=1 Tax=Streptosporangium sp. CA-115845 TaxID=3240071 RepID=UPI003D8CC550
MLSRVLSGARVTLPATMIVIAAAALIGTVAGTVAALGGKVVDEVLMRITDIGTILREHLLPNEPEELELSVIELADGSGSLSMRMRDGALTLPGVTDISTAGGWRAYLASGRTQGAIG